MSRPLNLVRDPHLSGSARFAQPWRWQTRAAQGARRTWLTSSSGSACGVSIECPQPVGMAVLSQSVPVRGGAHYRVEGLVACRTRVAGDRVTPDHERGFVLEVQGLAGARAIPGECLRRILHETDGAILLGGYLCAPRKADALRIRVGLFGASGTAHIELVRVLRILPPEAGSHPLAIPPPPQTYPAPRRVQSVAIWEPGVTATIAGASHAGARIPSNAGARILPALDAAQRCQGSRTMIAGIPSHENAWPFAHSKRADTSAATDRPESLAAFLRQHIGAPDVRELPDLVGEAPNADALILRGDAPPPALDSMRSLTDWGRRRLVIVSLPIFAKLAGKAVTLRRIEQEDDPIHARVAYANYITRGFALHDIFPYAWAGRAPGWSVQRQYKLGRRFKDFCRRNGWVTVLESVCVSDATSGRPICLHKELDGGGIVVLDVEPFDRAWPTASDEPVLAAHVLRNILGFPQPTAGQFTVPASDEKAFRQDIAELAVRFDGVRVDSTGGGVEASVQQLVRLDESAERQGLPQDERGSILLRSGFRGDDFEAIYGCFHFIKQLVRPPPYTWPQAAALLAKFRVRWRPLQNSWHWDWGFARRHAAAPEADTPSAGADIDLSAARVALLIDVVTSRETEARIVFARETDLSAHVFSTRTTIGPDAFDLHLQRQAAAAGTMLVRVEVPGSPGNFVSHSIVRTGRVMLLLGELLARHAGCPALDRTGRAPLAPREVVPLSRALPPADPLLIAAAHSD